MGLHVLLVGRLRPELGVSGTHDGLPVADIRHEGVVQTSVAELAGSGGELFVTCLQQDLREVRRALALVSVALPHVVTVLEPLPGPPLAVAVGSALAGGAGANAGAERQLAMFDQLRAGLWAAVWLPKVGKLSYPSPTLVQHVRGVIPGGDGFFAIFDDAPRVIGAGRLTDGGLDRTPANAMLVSAVVGAPSWVESNLANAVTPLSTAELSSWRSPADAFGVQRAAEFVLVPSEILDGNQPMPDYVTECRGCGRRHPRDACPFCGMAVSDERVMEPTGEGDTR